MRKSTIPLFVAVTVLALAAGAAFAQGGQASARLRAFDEVPALSTPAVGHFSATVSADGSSMTYHLDYSHLEGDVLQAHIHFAQKGVNGGIMVFLCSNLGNGPAGTPACPADPGSVDGTITATEVVGGAAPQGIAPGELFSVLRAMRAGIAYANVHTNVFPGGEIRGQVKFTSSDD